MDLVYRMIHVTLSMWFFAAAALHAGLHLVPLLGSALMSVFSVAANHLVKRVGLWVLFLLAVARIWIASETRTFDLLFTFESAYIPVERGELPFLMPLDLLLLFLLLAFVGYGVSWIAAKRSASR